MMPIYHESSKWIFTFVKLPQLPMMPFSKLVALPQVKQLLMVWCVSFKLLSPLLPPLLMSRREDMFWSLGTRGRGEGPAGKWEAENSGDALGSGGLPSTHCSELYGCSLHELTTTPLPFSPLQKRQVPQFEKLFCHILVIFNTHLISWLFSPTFTAQLLIPPVLEMWSLRFTDAYKQNPAILKQLSGELTT